ncbi:unnamed protein product, partial [Symbiodinium pilosum]
MWKTYKLLPDPNEDGQQNEPLAVVWDDCQGQLECIIFEVIHELVADTLPHEPMASKQSWLSVCFGSFSILGSWGPGYRRHKACLFANFAIFDRPEDAEERRNLNHQAMIGGWPVTDDDLACFAPGEWKLLRQP